VSATINNSGKGNISFETSRGGLSQMRGGAMACAWKHIWLLIFFVLFASRQKEHKRKYEHC
jgi:hypothetical protein